MQKFKLITRNASSPTKYSYSGSTTGKYIRVTVSGCGDEDKECILKKNTVANITIDFESSECLI